MEKDNILNLRGLSLLYNNKEMAKQMVEEIFENSSYFFETKRKTPLIIDAGSNIGVATLFFKSIYKDAKILCFEPDPNSFALLKQNIIRNHLTDVSLYNKAVAGIEGKIKFYGHISSKVPYSCGNSIIRSWGEQRNIDDNDYLRQNSIYVQAVKLSSYIDSNVVDFLKLDIEGAERQVLEELQDKLELIKAMSIEVHCTTDKEFNDHLNSIVFILRKYNFEFEIIEKNNNYIFPAQTLAWVKRKKPKLFEIRACKKNENKVITTDDQQNTGIIKMSCCL